MLDAELNQRHRRGFLPPRRLKPWSGWRRRRIQIRKRRTTRRKSYYIIFYISFRSPPFLSLSGTQEGYEWGEGLRAGGEGCGLVAVVWAACGLRFGSWLLPTYIFILVSWVRVCVFVVFFVKNGPEKYKSEKPEGGEHSVHCRVLKNWEGGQSLQSLHCKKNGLQT